MKQSYSVEEQTLIEAFKKFLQAHKVEVQLLMTLNPKLVSSDLNGWQWRFEWLVGLGWNTNAEFIDLLHPELGEFNTWYKHFMCYRTELWSALVDTAYEYFHQHPDIDQAEFAEWFNTTQYVTKDVYDEVLGLARGQMSHCDFETESPNDCYFLALSALEFLLNSNKQTIKEESMAKKWVILVDVQKDFIDGALRNEEAIKKVPNIIEKIKNLDKTVEIIATQDTHKSDYLSTYEGKNLPVPHCIADTEGWNINKDVEETLKESGLKYMKVRKPTFGCYALGYIIESGSEYGEPESIEICGFCTDICVVSNALMLRAHFPNVPITVDASCCAGVTPESHKAALMVMKACQINVVNED